MTPTGKEIEILSPLHSALYFFLGNAILFFFSLSQFFCVKYIHLVEHRSSRSDCLYKFITLFFSIKFWQELKLKCGCFFIIYSFGYFEFPVNAKSNGIINLSKL